MQVGSSVEFRLRLVGRQGSGRTSGEIVVGSLGLGGMAAKLVRRRWAQSLVRQERMEHLAVMELLDLLLPLPILV